MFKYTRKAQYHETDQMGIIHHSNYVKWMEEARVGFLDAIGLGYKTIEELGVVSPVTGIEVEYKRQVQFDDEVEINISIERYNGIRLELKYEFYNKTKQEICTVANSKHCFMKDGKVVSLGKALPDLHEKLMKEVNVEGR